MIVPWATRLSFARMWYAFGAFWILGSDRLRLAFYSGLDALTGRSCFSQNFDQVAFYSALPFRADQCCIHGIQPFVSLTSKFMVSVVTNTTKSFISWSPEERPSNCAGPLPQKSIRGRSAMPDTRLISSPGCSAGPPRTLAQDDDNQHYQGWK